MDSSPGKFNVRLVVRILTFLALDGETRSSKGHKKRKRDAAQEPLEDSTDKPSPSKKKKKKKQDRERESDPTPAETTVTSQQPSPSSEPSTKECSPAEAEAFLKKHSITISNQTQGDAVVPVTSFDQLIIPDGLRGAFTGFKEPTPIQACTWPPALKGKDVVGIAETGR